MTFNRPEVNHLPEGEIPLLQWTHRPLQDRRPLELTLPEVHVWVGRDLRSSGATIQAWVPRVNKNPDLRSLYAARWAVPITSVEEALRLVPRVAAAALAELFPPDASQ